MRSSTSRLFIKSLAITFVSIFIAVAVFNFTIDPFDMFGFPQIEGLNAEKPEFGKNVRMTKAHAVRMLRPSGLVLGSSRAEFGLDPEHPGWMDAARPVYNLALPSGSIYEALRYLQHAHALHPVKQLALNLDMFMFNATQQRQIDYREERLARHPGLNLQMGWLRDLTTALFTIDGLRASVNTLRNQQKTSHLPHLANGARHTTRNWALINRKGGHRGAFLSNERYSLEAVDGWALFTFEGPGATRPGLDAFRQLVRFCLRENIDLHVMISPVHARKLEVLWQLGMWPIFEDWKRELVRVLTTDRSGIPSPMIPLWDFSGYNSINTEAVPQLGDKETQMQWYWEGSHFKKDVGDLMLNRVFGKTELDSGTAGRFGVSLTAGNIEEHLKSLRTDHAEFVDSHPDTVAEIAFLIQDTEDERIQLARRNSAHRNY